MDAEQFREFGKAAVDFVADYLENIRDCDVLSAVKPGYLYERLPKEIPEKGEDWQAILQGIKSDIIPGITHWQSPNMHAFYPTACSYPSIVGEMLASAFGVIGFNWICSPACTELEVIVMDWLAKFLKLPEHFLHSASGTGGGVIQGSASESVLVAMIAAREQTVRSLMAAQPERNEHEIRGKLIAYAGNQSNSCIEKSALIAALPIRLLPAGDDLVFHGDALKNAVERDIADGYIPTVCIATLGTTGTCAYDDIAALAEVCEKHGIWLHVDAAYAGIALALDEYKHLHKGLDRVDSLNFNLHKSLLVNFDCTAMWLRDANMVVDNFNVERIYLKHERAEQGAVVPDFRHWQIPLGRRFRALKVWTTFRTLGAEGLRAHIHQYRDLAKRFEDFVLEDPRFEIVAEPQLGLVCFRVKGDNRYTVELLNRLTERKKIYMVQGKHQNQHFLRFVVCGFNPLPKDIDFAWNEIETQLTQLLKEDSKEEDKLPRG